MSDNTKPTLAIMAAGLGKRYGGLKQIEPVHGNPVNGHILLEYSIFDVYREGFGKIVILARKEFEKDIQKHGDRMAEATNLTVEYAYQPSVEEVKQKYPFREKMWGTGHAVLCFENKVKEPFAAINADNLYGRKSFKSLYKFFTNGSYDPKGNIHALVGYRLKNVVYSQKPIAEAICKVSSDGFLESIVERTEIMRRGDTFVYRENSRENPLNPDSIISATQWGFNPTIFHELSVGFEEFLEGVIQNKEPKKEFYLSDFLNGLIAKGRIKIKVLPTEERCFGMTYKEDKFSIQLEIEKLTGKGLYPDRLWEKNW